MSRLQRVPMRCQACGRDFTGDLLVEVPVARAVAHMRAMTCPHCGARANKIGIVAAKSEAAP